MKTFTMRINFSGADFQNEFNDYDKRLPTWEAVSEEVTVEIENGEIVKSSHTLGNTDKKVILIAFNETK